MTKSRNESMRQRPPTVLPQNIEAEQSVLGAILVDPEAIHKIDDALLPVHFYREAHSLIYDTMLSMAENGETVDLVTLVERLKEDGRLEKVGGATYLSGLAAGSITSLHIFKHAHIIREMSFRRKIIDGSARIGVMAGDVGEDLDDTSERIQQLLFSLSADRLKDCDHSVGSAMVEALSGIETAYVHQGSVTGIRTHFLDLDKLLCGFQKTDLIIIAARPSIGKTALALQIAHNVADKDRIPVGVFSLEMSKEQLGTRLVTMKCSISSDRMKRGQISADEFEAIMDACGHISGIPLYIDDVGARTALEIRSISRKWVLERGVRLIVIDYLQLMRAGRKTENRNLEIGYITQSLKAMAKELKIPVIVVSQLNRKCEDRVDKRPTLGDLRESGDIEQASDVVLFIYRDEYYYEKTKDKGIAEILIRKNRNGPTANIRLTFLPQFTRFENLSKRNQYPDYQSRSANDD